MDWKSPFIVYRITPDGKLEEVYHAVDLKKAKYWLTYIAQPGDVCCRTPAHPRHSKKTPTPEYFSHKQESGTPSSVESEWKSIAESKKLNVQFPSEQQKEPVI